MTSPVAFLCGGRRTRARHQGLEERPPGIGELLRPLPRFPDVKVRLLRVISVVDETARCLGNGGLNLGPFVPFVELEQIEQG